MTSHPGASAGKISRQTFIVDGPLALRAWRADAARSAALGREIMTMPILASRLAGGFTQLASQDVLYPLIKTILAQGGFAELGRVADLPGTPRAVLQALQSLWLADVRPETLSAGAVRMAELSGIEVKLRAGLGSRFLLLPDLRDKAITRADRAPDVLGSIEIFGVCDFEPIWHPLINRLAERFGVRWDAPVDWERSWFASKPTIRQSHTPPVTAECCADPRAEVVESLRWVRALLAKGVEARDIAVASASPQQFDEHFIVLATDADLPISFTHGRPALAAPEGQICAALAEVLVNGLARERLFRLFLHLPWSEFRTALPSDWWQGLRADAPLNSLEQWRHALRAAREQNETAGTAEPVLLEALELLVEGPVAAVRAGERLLSGPSRALWASALSMAPAEALPLSLRTLRIVDSRDPADAVSWGPAVHLAHAPRPYTRLIGLNGRSWPRADHADPLLPHHVIRREILHPVTMSQHDRLLFAAIGAGTSTELVLSRAQRDARGSKLVPSVLWPGDTVVHRRDRIPDHAMSEADRLLARRNDAAVDPRLVASRACWQDWHKPILTAHDGVVAPNHPAIAAELTRLQSPSSLQRLACDPIGFVWRYVLGWHAPVDRSLRLELDALSYGILVHALISAAVSSFATPTGFAGASADQVEAAVDAAAGEIEEDWKLRRAVPPAQLWRSILAEAVRHTAAGLAADDPIQSGTRTWTELPFGAEELSDDGPWDAAGPVPIDGTGLMLGGRIDRLDLRHDRAVRITDYKSGAPPRPGRRVTLGRGSELQRVLYALAARKLLVDVKGTVARLSYLGPSPLMLKLQDEDLDKAIEDACRYLSIAEKLLRDGALAPRSDADRLFDDMRLLLPAERQRYLERKRLAFTNINAPLSKLWSVE